MTKQIKIQIISDYQEYKKGQIILLDEKSANNLLTSSKALRIHRELADNQTELKFVEEPATESKDKNKKSFKAN